MLTIVIITKKIRYQTPMPTTFSKPVQEEIPRNARKRTLNPKLTSTDNVHEDAVKKRRIHEESNMSKSTPATHPKSAVKKTPAAKNKTAAQPKPRNSRQASVEDVTEDEDHYEHRNAGHVKNPNSILEAADGSDESDDSDNDPEMPPPLVVDDEPEDDEDEVEEVIQEETDEQELGILTV